MPVYSIDLKLAATAYVRAKDRKEARAIIKEEFFSGLSGLEVHEGPSGDYEICGLQYDDPRLPKVSLSPAMTIHGTWNNRVEPDLAAEEDADELEEDEEDE